MSCNENGNSEMKAFYKEDFPFPDPKWMTPNLPFTIHSSSKLFARSTCSLLIPQPTFIKKVVGEAVEMCDSFAWVDSPQPSMFVEHTQYTGNNFQPLPQMTNHNPRIYRLSVLLELRILC